MKITRAASACCASVLLQWTSACGSDGAVNQTDFGDTAHALGSETVSASELSRRLEVRRNAIREHFNEKLGALEIVETTRLESGTIVDWVAAAKPLVPPPPPPELPALGKNEEWAETELQTQPWARGPEGTYPRIRFDVEGWLRGKGADLPDGPAELIEYRPSPLLPANQDRLYNDWRLVTPAGNAYWGAGANIEVWDVPDLEVTDTSIAQLAVTRGNGVNVETLEVGKIEFNDGTCASSACAAKLFIFWTTNNYGRDAFGNLVGPITADFIGGYDDDALGFQWLPGLLIAPGDTLVNLSTPSTRKFLNVQVMHSDPGNSWWIAVNGQWLGYYPECNNGSTDVACSASGATYTFGKTGLRTVASRLIVFGEVFDHNRPNLTTTDMGAGFGPAFGQAQMNNIVLFPLGSQTSASWQVANTSAIAPIGSLSPFVSLGAPYTTAHGNIQFNETDPDCYRLGAIHQSTSTGTTFNYGGFGLPQQGCDGIR